MLATAAAIRCTVVPWPAATRAASAVSPARAGTFDESGERRDPRESERSRRTEADPGETRRPT